MKSTQHGLPLYLSAELNMGLVDLQHKKRLGRSYAGLLALVEGLYQFDCITQEVYEKFLSFFSAFIILVAMFVLAAEFLFFYNLTQNMILYYGYCVILVFALFCGIRYRTRA